MSLNLAMHIMGVNLSQLDYLVKILDIKPGLISESVNLSNSKNTQQNAVAIPKKQCDNFLEQLQLRHTDDEEAKKLNVEKFLEFCSSKESKWQNAVSHLPKWKTQFTSPLRTTSSSVFHVLGANEQLYYLENDNEGFGVPIPYDFKNDGDHGYFYANYFGDQEPYNYSGSNNSTELVDGILRISEIFMGERKNLANRQERDRAPAHPEDQEYEVDECNIFANENVVSENIEIQAKDEQDDLPIEENQKYYFLRRYLRNLSLETSDTESTSSDDEIDDWRNINIENLIR